MNDVTRTKDQMTTLDDLKVMIDGYTRNKTDPDAHWHRAEAWCTAFEWRDILARRTGPDDYVAEYNEGMRLIREKLS